MTILGDNLHLLGLGKRRVYVVSFAPSYDEGAVGGNEWRVTRGEALAAFAELAADEGSDFRLVVLDLPASMTDEEVDDFLASGPGTELVEPPDPRADLDGALECWRENER